MGDDAQVKGPAWKSSQESPLPILPETFDHFSL